MLWLLKPPSDDAVSRSVEQIGGSMPANATKLDS
jgi:hypothetical protein